MGVDPTASSWWETAAVLAFGAVSGLFAFTHKRIGDVQTEAKADQVAEILALKQELDRFDRVFTARFNESRDDRAEQWKAIQSIERRSTEMHAQNLEKLAQIPTRDEMMRMLQQFMQRPPR